MYPDGTSHVLVGGPPGWEKAMVSGKTPLSLPPGSFLSSNERINLNGKAPVTRPSNESAEQGRRLNTRTNGSKTVLAVRIIDTTRNAGEQQPTFSLDTLRTEVFGGEDGAGTAGDICLTSQYRACSYDNLIFKPKASETSGNTGQASNIVNGVVDVYVNTGCTTNACDSTLHNAASTALNNAFGRSASSLATHVSKFMIFCAIVPFLLCSTKLNSHAPSYLSTSLKCTASHPTP